MLLLGQTRCKGLMQSDGCWAFKAEWFWRFLKLVGIKVKTIRLSIKSGYLDVLWIVDEYHGHTNEPNCANPVPSFDDVLAKPLQQLCTSLGKFFCSGYEIMMKIKIYYEIIINSTLHIQHAMLDSKTQTRLICFKKAVYVTCVEN